MINFEEWSTALEKAWNLNNEQDDKQYSDLMYALTGEEDIRFLHKIIESVRLQDDNGLYESTYNAIWRFPEKTTGAFLAQVLPEFQKRMGKYDQVQRFYLCLTLEGEAQDAFIQEAKNWNKEDRKTGLKAIKEWEAVFQLLGKPLAKTPEDPIPGKWPDEWKKRLQDWRNEPDIDKANSLFFWRKSKKEWIEDLDFLIAVLMLKHGKRWRELDTLTNPLWFYAKKAAYPEFVVKVKALPEDEKTAVLESFKRFNKRKYQLLVNDLQK